MVPVPAAGAVQENDWGNVDEAKAMLCSTHVSWVYEPGGVTWVPDGKPVVAQVPASIFEDVDVVPISEFN